MPLDRLAVLMQGDGEAVPTPLLVGNDALLRAVQSRLAFHGLLDPPDDGYWGPVSTWALHAFCRSIGMEFPDGVDQPLAAALLAETPALPLAAGAGSAATVLQALLRRGDWFCRHPDCFNIVYLEGRDLDGAATRRRPDAFDDVRLLLRCRSDGVAELAGAWQATTGAGRPAVKQPAEPVGAPRLVPGQHKAWVMGRTAIGTELEQEALVQAAPLPVTRDTGQDFQRGGDPVQRGLFVIDQHSGMDAPPDQVGGVGAGCLVGRERLGHAAFMALLRTDRRWRANNAYRFMTSLLSADEIAE